MTGPQGHLPVDDLCEAFELAPQGLLLSDANGVVAAANAAARAVLGLPQALPPGLGLASLLVPGQREALDAALTELHGQGRHVGCWTLRGPDGPLQLELDTVRLKDGSQVTAMRDMAGQLQQEEALRRMAAELERKVQERTRQLRDMTLALETAGTQERRQIALDLHDDLGQILAAARIRLAVLCRHADEDVRQQASGIAQLLERANRATRSLAAQLAPAALYELGLVPALHWLAEEIFRTYGMRVDVDDDGLPKPLSQLRRDVTYRVVRELLVNVARHAGVSHAGLGLRRHGGNVEIVVQDDGVGIDLVRAAQPRGFGLASVRERLSVIGGSFELHSVVGDGTRAHVRVPLGGSDGQPQEGP